VAAVNALVVLAPPLFSTDVFSYQAYARIWATYGSNPYLHGPYAISLDPVYHYIGSKWIFTPSVYGPLFTVLSGLLAPVSVALSAVTFKAVAALSSIATITLIWHGARLRGLDPVRAVALFGLNPLVVVYGVGGGHNDLLMLVLATAGIHALLAHRERMSGAMIVLATGIKLTGGVLLPFALASGAKLGAPTRRRKLLTGAGVAGAAVAVAGFAAFGGGVLNLLPTLQRVQAAGDWHSIPGFITTVFGVGSIGRLAGVLLGVAFVGVTAWLLRRVWRGEMDWIDGVGWATLAMLVTASSILPWYVCWLLPPVALCTDRRLWKASLVLSGVILFTTMLGYVPFGVSLFGMRLVP
jgi:alpha-1,6-mannosyltransferase